MMDKYGVARALREIGQLLELEGENPFKIRAYESGARALETLEEDLGEVIARDGLREIAGIGPALAKKITDLHTTGRTDLLDRLHARFPPGMLDLLRVPDLGPRKIAALHAALGIASVADLAAACEGGRVRELKGFGEKTERRILENLARMAARDAGRRWPFPDAFPLAERLLAHVRRSGAVERAELAGSLRRFREEVGDLDLVAASRDPAGLADHFVAFPLVADVLARGDTKVAVRLAGGLQVDLRIVPPEDFATALHHFTGSAAHHVKLRGLARDRGYTLSEWGLVAIDGGAKVPVETEDDLYRALGMAPIPPELRENQGEIEAALAGRGFDDLVRAEDVRGMVHCHTVWSDGRATIEEMALAAEAMGMEYLTITDHSGRAHYAGGVTPERIEQQWDEIARVQEKVRVRLLRGTEADILEDGALDWPDRILERFEVIVASIHERHRMDERAMTRRLVRAMEIPVFKIWGHALGRLLGEREPFACRVEEVLDAAAASGRVAIEVNGDPRRLDMEPRWIRAARERRLPFVLSVDAHSTASLEYLRFAAGTARRGGVRRSEVLNAFPAAEFAAAVRPVRA